ncbi:MAG: hypothetical protein SVV03_04870 [Candidatus Nanohaloarchaea archaeon]|nr:hypothetical protein [Candidatus Nanohaloarchaea archaeon]
MGDEYYVCPECGYKQKSEAEKRIKCHRCKKSYKRRTAKTAEKKPDQEKGKGFFQYSSEGG